METKLIPLAHIIHNHPLFVLGTGNEKVASLS